MKTIFEFLPYVLLIGLFLVLAFHLAYGPSKPTCPTCGRRLRDHQLSEPKVDEHGNTVIVESGWCSGPACGVRLRRTRTSHEDSPVTEISEWAKKIG